MTWFNHLKLAPKLLIAFLALLSLTAFLGVFALMELSEVRDTSRELATNSLQSTEVASDIDTNFSAFRLSQHEHILGDTPEQLADAEGDQQQALQA
ncbi:MAG: MCP four helix bundle domain-containing protein, partial [Archangium sp.]